MTRNTPARTSDGIWVELVDGPIAAKDVRDFIMGDPTLGGIVTFEGATRREVDPAHGPIARLDYEAYGSMAVKQLKHLALEVKHRYSAGRIAIVHRTGGVPPGEVAVMISVACRHRAEAFEACRRLIDRIKKDVPIWKKELFDDGHVRWANARRSVDD